MNKVSVRLHPTTRQRGSHELSIREQIIEAANEHFAHYGYSRTTVADLAKAIGFSKAYIYKFFDSKQAIGEAICGRCLDDLIAHAQNAIAEGQTATDKMRRLFKTIVSSSVELFFQERKLFDIAAHSVGEKWRSSQTYVDNLEGLVRQIIQEGRDNGEFERKTPMDETCDAILQAMECFCNPMMLQFKLTEFPDASTKVVNLILRSLAP